MKRFICLFFIALLLPGCIATTKGGINTFEGKHMYQIGVYDIFGNPIEAAKIECLYNNSVDNEYDRIQCETNKEGAAIIKRDVSNATAPTRLNCEITKEGYRTVEEKRNISVKPWMKYGYPYHEILEINLVRNDFFHKYNLKIIDSLSLEPIENAKIKGIISYQNNKKVVRREVNSNTDAKGEFSGSILIPNYKRKSQFQYKITKEYYYPKEGKMDIKFVRTKEVGFENTKIVHLASYLHLFSTNFPNSKNAVALKKKVISFLETIKWESLLAKTVLVNRSINLVDFQGKKYLQMKFNNAIEYNSLHFNKYDIGKKIFDEVLRKILNPLNNNLYNESLIFGYDFVIIGRQRNFSQNDKTTLIEYRFLIPKKSAKEYKDKHITNQGLLDESIILMDGDRIGLEF